MKHSTYRVHGNEGHGDEIAGTRVMGTRSRGRGSWGRDRGNEGHGDEIAGTRSQIAGGMLDQQIVGPQNRRFPMLCSVGQWSVISD